MEKGVRHLTGRWEFPCHCAWSVKGFGWINVLLGPSLPGTYSQITRGRKNAMICSQSGFIFSRKINRLSSGQELLDKRKWEGSLFLRSYSFMGSNPFGSRGADDLSRSDSLGLKNGNGAVNLYLQLSAVNLLMNTVLGLHTSIYHKPFLIITFGPHVSWKQTVRCKSKVLKWYILM